MDIRQENRPVCECHAELMYWHKDKTRKNGGRWRCSIKRNIQESRWKKDNPDKVRKKYSKWNNSQKGTMVKYKYRNSIKGYITKRKWVLNKMRKNILNQLEELENVK